MKFTKMQGAGNDFVLVEAGDMQKDWSRVAVAMCDRHYGIGADGLLLLLPSDAAGFRMRIFNADGSESDACGNGIRCLSKYIFDSGLITNNSNQISIETLGGIRDIKLDKREGKIIGIQAGMGKPAFNAIDIPVMLEQGKDNIVDIKSMLGYTVNINGMGLLLNFVSMGNPHAIHFCQESLHNFPLAQIGPKVEQLDIFPNRTNFEIARVLNRREIEVRVWERGVGETLACGSGACAVTVAAQLYGYIEPKVNIKLPGGTLRVEWDGVGEVFMNGPAETVFTGEWPD